MCRKHLKDLHYDLVVILQHFVHSIEFKYMFIQ